ncbi:STAS domain-containing protein [Streptomyces sp. NPDC048568]|uniref:STAS domain-containing protein n=1 Tax=Streptomyces sp. NPDC048568 TaxID=3365571 RepID=UPI00372079F4
MTTGPPNGNATSVVSLSVTDQAAIVVLHGEIDLTAHHEVTRCFEAAVRSGLPLVADLSGVTFADSTALNMLLRVTQEVPLSLAGPLAPQVSRLFEVSGVGAVLIVLASREAAVRHASRTAGARKSA